MTLESFFAQPEGKGRLYLFYGLSGCGKTFTSMTAANEKRRVILIDTELRALDKRENKFKGKPIDIIEPIVLDKLMQLPALEGTDSEKSIARVANALIEISKSDLDNFVVVIDTMSEIWKMVQEAGKRRLARAGKIDLDTLALNRQFDWGTITAMHYKLVLMLRMLTRIKTCNVIMTARANWIPEYVGEKEDIYTMSQKDLPFLSDVVVQLRRRVQEAGTRRMTGEVMAVIEKAGDEDISKLKPIMRPTFDDIKMVAEGAITGSVTPVRPGGVIK